MINQAEAQNWFDIINDYVASKLWLVARARIFYTGLVKLKNEIVNYKEYLTLSLENKHDVQLYIDELKKTNKT